MICVETLVMTSAGMERLIEWIRSHGVVRVDVMPDGILRIVSFGTVWGAEASIIDYASTVAEVQAILGY